MKPCPFCDEITQGADNVFMTSPHNLFAARWDLYPASPGHVEIVPRRHVRYVSELTTDELAEMMSFAVQVLENYKDVKFEPLYQSLLPLAVDEMSRGLLHQALQKAAMVGKADGHTLGINDGEAAGQSVPHLHLHIIPRWNGDVPNPKGGIRNLFASDPYSHNK